MIRIIKKIPNNVVIACSGGIDSMAFTHFLRQCKRKVKLAKLSFGNFGRPLSFVSKLFQNHQTINFG